MRIVVYIFNQKIGTRASGTLTKPAPPDINRLAVPTLAEGQLRLLLYARTLVGLSSRIPKGRDLVQTLLLQCDRPPNSDGPHLARSGHRSGMPGPGVARELYFKNHFPRRGDVMATFCDATPGRGRRNVAHRSQASLSTSTHKAKTRQVLLQQRRPRNSIRALALAGRRHMETHRHARLAQTQTQTDDGLRRPRHGLCCYQLAAAAAAAPSAST
jgi:hypothetical protein